MACNLLSNKFPSPSYNSNFKELSGVLSEAKLSKFGENDKPNVQFGLLWFFLQKMLGSHNDVVEYYAKRGFE
jgi:hypothetical protein